MLLAVESQFLNSSDTISFTYGSSYQIACIAHNSIPLLSLSIYANNINLNSLSGSNNKTVIIIKMDSICKNLVCYSSLVLNLTFNDIRLAEVDIITCVASNITSPFNLTSSKSVQAESN